MNDFNYLDNHYYTVTIDLCPNVRPIKGVWHVKWEEDLVKAIQCHTFVFAVTTMKQAVEKVQFLTDNHPVGYFSSINIKYYKTMTL